jgi:hypothetical protein
VLGSVPGITYLADQGRPRASEVVAFWPALISRHQVTTRVVVGDEEVEVPPFDPAGAAAGPSSSPTPVRVAAPSGGEWLRVPLSRLCLARSGDKGDTANVGVIARSPSIYAWVLDTLTSEFVEIRFAGLCRGGVERYELPNLLAVNFVLRQSLGGGGTVSLLVDAQGKTYAQFLLATEVDVDEALLEGLDGGL